MNNLVKKFLELLKEKPCNHDKCRELIKEIGITNTITDNLGFKTTPLHLVVESNNYELATERLSISTKRKSISKLSSQLAKKCLSSTPLRKAS